ncbi:hypothetical protein ACFV16_29260 [Streptomyces massasporeus]
MTDSTPAHGTWEPHPATRRDAPSSVRTSSGAESLHLVAGEDHVLALRAW